MHDGNTTGTRRQGRGGVEAGAAHPSFGAWAAALVAALIGSAAAAAPAWKTEEIQPGLYRIGGAGGGTVLRVDAKGLVLVDAQPEDHHRSLMDEVQRITKRPALPVRALMPTALGRGQAANVVPFAAAGVPVVVQQQVLPRLLADLQARGARVPATAFVSYHTDYLLRDGNLEAEIEHVGRGRTGADSVVFFRDLRVVALGELFTHDAPQPDCASGGSFAGWASAVTHVLWFDFDVAVPSRGAPVGKRELAAFKARLDALAARPASASDCRPSPK